MKGQETPGVIVGVDIGGTFTDIVVVRDGSMEVYKLPTTPQGPATAVLRGMRELGLGYGTAIVHGSTVATNALLERKGARTALVTTRGFEDVLEIGRQNRSRLYDLFVTRPAPLVPSDWRLGASERVDSSGRVVELFAEAEATRLAKRIQAGGIEAVEVCFLFSFLNPEHERMMKRALEQSGAGAYVYLSSEVLPEYREYERTSTTVINAYIAPVVHRYVSELEREIGAGLRIMQSSGGWVTPNAVLARPVQSISGGPAAGVIGAFHLAQRAGFSQVIGFDMGGTSTDVSLCPGRVLETNEWSLGGLPIRTPALDVYSVGAGGGSIARIDPGGALLVGPESAGADPGPACYGKGSLPTVTDANLVLGRLDPEGFLGGKLSLQPQRAEEALRPLAQRMGLSLVEAAAGVVQVANAHMEGAVRVVSVERGYDPRDFTLVAFGGAGPMHARELAQALGIPRVLVPPHPGVLSALGMTIAPVARDYAATVMLRQATLGKGAIDVAFDRLLEQGRQDMEAMGVAAGQVTAARALDMRYVGQSNELTVPYGGEPLEEVIEAFHGAHEERYGYGDRARPIEVVNVRLKMWSASPRPAQARQRARGADPGHAALGSRSALFDGRPCETAIYARERLKCGNLVPGPAILFQYDSTTVVPPGWSAQVDGFLNLIISLASPLRTASTKVSSP